MRKCACVAYGVPLVLASRTHCVVHVCSRTYLCHASRPPIKQISMTAIHQPEAHEPLCFEEVCKHAKKQTFDLPQPAPVPRAGNPALGTDDQSHQEYLCVASIYVQGRCPRTCMLPFCHSTHVETPLLTERSKRGAGHRSGQTVSA